MVPIEGMGVALEYAPGPVIGEPIRTMAQVDALRTLEPERDVPFVMEAINHTRAGLPAHVPLIYFANQCGGSLAHIATLDVDVIGLDWRTSLGGARKILGESKAIQGNLDPAHLFSSPTELKKRVDEVFADIGPGPGHIFNLGHGIWPETDPDSVARLVDYVHEKSAK